VSEAESNGVYWAQRRTPQKEKRFMHRRLAMLLMLITVIFGGLPVSHGAMAILEESAAEYVCPPCGCGKDDQVHDKPGFCSVCGMPLIVKGSSAAAPPPAEPEQARKKAAILIFDGVQIIDYTGPYEVFGQAGLDVFTVAAKAQMITTSMGMKVTPHHTLADAPAADVLIIPGGNVSNSQQDPEVIKWIQERSKQAEYVLSVCNGAYILAKTGLLDGLTATTFYGLIDGLSAVAPKVKVVKDQRYVDNGKYITTAGISSGIDGSLYVVSKLFGKANAQMAALNMEYDWKPNSTYARASLADRQIQKVFGIGLRLGAPSGARSKVLSTEGTSRDWEVRWQIEGEATPAAVLKLLGDRLAAAQWVEQRSEASKRTWKFNDGDGGEWHGVAEIQPSGAKIAIVSLKIERTGTSAVKNSNAAEKLLIRNAWIQEMPPSRNATAAYLIIENMSESASALLAARADIAGAVELHRAEMDNGMMRMRKLDRINLPVGQTEITGELHIMLIDVTKRLVAGDEVALTLQFENTISKTVVVPVKKRPTE
jgi:copper(I)-binding protein/putative intracellular protease/amidase